VVVDVEVDVDVVGSVRSPPVPPKTGPQPRRAASERSMTLRFLVKNGLVLAAIYALSAVAMWSAGAP
jgi:hypothetical protein